jgi:hypothetical protein
MATIFRAERKTDVKTETGALGPGAYDLTSQSIQPVEGTGAPFASLQERVRKV